MSIKITEIEHCDEQLVKAFARLAPQLSENAPLPTAERLQRIIDTPTSHLLAAVTDDGTIAGVLTLVFFDIPTYCKAWIEDVITDAQYRGQGIGKTLLKSLAKIAVSEGCGRLEWACLDWNEPSIEFYRAQGAVSMDEWTTYRLTGDALTSFAADEV